MAACFDFHETELSGLVVISRKPVGDQRGFLERLFCADELQDISFTKPILQINRTLTHRKGAVRGMHYQNPPHAEIKIVSCLRGEVYDVAVDLRQGSPTFLRWHGEILSENNNKSIMIPEGFAHGFQTLGEDCEMLYFHTAKYNYQAEDGIHSRDPRLEINWPLPVSDLSPRDETHALIDDDFIGVCL